MKGSSGRDSSQLGPSGQSLLYKCWSWLRATHPKPGLDCWPFACCMCRQLTADGQWPKLLPWKPYSLLVPGRVLGAS